MAKQKILHVLKTFLQSGNAHAASVQTFDIKTGKLNVIVSSGLRINKEAMSYTAKNSLSEIALKKRTLNTFTKTGKSTKTLPPFLNKKIISSVITIPLIIDGNVAGVLQLYYSTPYTPDKKILEIIECLASHISLIMENTKLKKKSSIFSNLANIDGLTGLYNHKYFQETLIGELSRARRFKYPVTLLMMDLDHFKNYNDTYGHPAGDEVLKRISKIIIRNTRSYDISARYGGEEFVILLPYTKRTQAMVMAERIRKEVAGTRFGKEKQKKPRITISIGIAVYPINAKTKEALVARSDQALYLAKEEGRNRICSSLVISKDIIRIAFCPPVKDVFYSLVLRGIREVMEDMGNIEIIVKAPKTESSSEQSLMVEDAINSGVDALTICSKTESLITELINKANSRKTPVFLFNIVSMKKSILSKVVSSIGFNQEEAGKKVGKYLVRLLRSKGNIAILEGLSGQSDSIQRRKGFLSIVKSFPEINIITSEPGDWKKNKANKIVKQILKKYPGIDAFYAESDQMALGAADAVEAAGMKNRVFITGLDGTPGALDYIAQGKLTATLNTNPIEMGRIIMRTVIRNMIKEEKIKKIIHSPTNIVSMENIDHYLIK